MSIQDDIKKLSADLKAAMKKEDFNEAGKLRDKLLKIADFYESKAGIIMDDNDSIKREAYETAYWALEAMGHLARLIRVCKKANRLYSAAAAAGRLGKPGDAIELYREMGWFDCAARVAKEQAGLTENPEYKREWNDISKQLYTDAIKQHEDNGWYLGAGDLAVEAEMYLDAIQDYRKARDGYRKSEVQAVTDKKPAEAEHYGKLAALMNRKVNEIFAKSG